VAERLGAGDRSQRTAHSLKDALVDGRVWLLSSIYFILAMGLYGLTLWVPQIVKDLVGGSATHVGLVCTIPYALAALSMVSWARYTDRTGRYRRNLTISLAVATAGMALASWLFDTGPVPTLIALSVGIVGLFSSFGPFWAVPGAFLRGAAAAGGIAVINSFGNLGGFASPPLVGKIKQLTGSFTGGLAFIASAMFVATMLIAVGVRDGERAGSASD
jgi:ACS family tartrate transporter-like MFS transporter